MFKQKNVILFITHLFSFLFGGLLILLLLTDHSNFKNKISNQNFNINKKKDQNQEKELPLNRYAFSELKDYDYQASSLSIEKRLEKNDKFNSYLFTYQSTGKIISGLINIPHSLVQTDADLITRIPTILMIRGWAPQKHYYTGFGSKPAAQHFAQTGFVTVAPDFLGYGSSDQAPKDPWEGRFVKPINVIELIKTLEEKQKMIISESLSSDQLLQKFNQIKTKNHHQLGIWAHSNGGQIALSVLEIYETGYPTVLWAPVTAPFPYSILFFSDEHEDEGKESRAWISLFEKDYDAFDFSITQHLDMINDNYQKPIQIHHGTADRQALHDWSREFIAKIETYNADPKKEKTISIELFSYPNADHNLRPAWSQVINRNTAFFKSYLTKTTSIDSKD